jgi:hypothetical protein
MLSRRQAPGPDASATSYRSTACQIGTHHACAESSPETAPVDLPLIYEACTCQCHAAPGRPQSRGNAVSGSASSGTLALNAEITERGSRE